MHNSNAGTRPTGWARIYNALFRVFGPAQLGDPDEPPPPPLPIAAPCPRCHQPMAAHRYVETWHKVGNVVLTF